MTTRAQLIEQLGADNRGGVKVYHPNKRALMWSAISWIAVVAATLWVSALRPGWVEQLIANPRFAIETLSGLLAILLLVVLLFRLGVPGSNRRWLTVGVVISGGVWLGSIVSGLLVPSLEFSMAGKREFCRIEVFVYALGPFLLGMYFLQKAYVLNWTLSAMTVGAASALVPAWLMQLACMYDPKHILEAHLSPVVVVAVFAAIIGFILQRRKTNNKRIKS